MQDADAVTAGGFVEVGGGPQDAPSLTSGAMDQCPEFPAGEWVDAYAWFIEQEQGRLAKQGADECQFLLHATGEFARQPGAEGREPCGFQQPGFLPERFVTR